MDPELPAELSDLNRLMLGPLQDRYDELKNNDDLSLVHYTSAEAFLSILSNEAVWMRNARCMNDFSEVFYAANFIQTYFSDRENVERFKSACDRCHPDAHSRISALVDGHLQSMLNDAYLVCLSEHRTKEDHFGRLSMWRGYGGRSVAVAVFLNKETVMQEGPYGLLGYPVRYPTYDELAADLTARIRFISDYCVELSKRPSKEFVNTLFAMLQILLTTTKHPGFKEEAEWRLIYMPNVYSSPGLERHKTQRCINGMPQTVYQIPLDGKPINEGMALTPAALIDSVVVEPCSEANVAIKAITDALRKAGHANPERAVRFCGIPYREKI